MNNNDSEHRCFEFSGAGGEYFRIWIVNLVLTLLTLGIYSAWAKVRRLQYFYRNTSLLGHGFDYHGSPIAILKGRLIGIGLFVVYNVAAGLNSVLGVFAFVLLLGILPWLIQRSMAFRLHNSSYRGLRFRFDGTVGNAYKIFLGWALLAYITLGISFPVLHHRIKAYQHGNSTFGTASFSFDARVKAFFMIYLKASGMMLIPMIVFGMFISSVVPTRGEGGPGGDPARVGSIMTTIFGAVVLLYLVLFLIVWPWFSGRMQNLVWNHTGLAQHRFASNVRARDLLMIWVINFIGIVLTLGLFKPFADIRIARYRLTHTGISAAGDLDEFIANEAQAVSATGEETADLFDVDISF